MDIKQDFINDCSSGDLVVAHWNTGSSKWENASVGAPVYSGSCGAGQAGTVSTNGTWNSFSPFTFGSKTRGSVLNPLPVELLSFDAKSNGNVVDISWQTASEKNCANFSVEKSQDGNYFIELIQVKGAGNSSTTHFYQVTDRDPYSGLSYYRLKQTDYNGSYYYSNIVPVKFNGSEVALSVYPTPSSGDFNISIKGIKGKEVLLVIRNMLGQEFYSKGVVLDNGLFIQSVNLSGKLAPGIYMVIASGDDRIYEKKIVIE